MSQDERNTANINGSKYKDFIKTSDFTLASTLYCLGFDILGIDKSNSRRVKCFFEKTSDIEVIIQKYFNNEIKINPLEFDRSQREIRAQIHTEI